MTHLRVMGCTRRFALIFLLLCVTGALPMLEYAILWMLIGATVVAVAGACLNRKARFIQRTIADLTPFFHRINDEFVAEIFDVEREAIAFHHSGNPRRERRRRMELVREYLRRMSVNNTVVLETANTEYKCMKQWPEDYDALKTARIHNMRQSAMLFHHCSQCVLAESWLWMLLSSFPSLRVSLPSAARLRYFGKLDLLRAYEQVRASTAEYARIFGEEYANEILASM